MKKTALVLSGGGSRGAYEIGVWKALKKLGIKINMVMGTSVGAINGAIIAQNDLKLSEKLWHQLETDMIFDVEMNGIPTKDALAYAKEIVIHGGAANSGLYSLLHKYINENKIKRSRIDFGLVMTEFPSFEGHFIYKDDIPKGELIDYIMASASCFPAVQKYIINGKKFIDGGYRDNLPVEMAMKRGASSVIAVDLQAVGIVRNSVLEKAEKTLDEFHLIKSPFDLGNFLIFDKLNTSKIMKLGYLDTMRHWKKYDGMKYTFKKRCFTKHQLLGADNAAYYLKLDPCNIYNEESVISAIKEQLQKFAHEDKEISTKEIISIISSITDNPITDEIQARILIRIANDLKTRQEKSLYLQPALF